MKAFDDMILAANGHKDAVHFNLPYSVKSKFKESDYPGYFFSYSKYIREEVYYLTTTPINDQDLFFDKNKFMESTLNNN